MARGPPVGRLPHADCLAAHNSLRARHGVGKLVWSQECTDLAQSCSILGPQVTIITGLVMEIRPLADTRLSSSRQNCSDTELKRKLD